MSFDVEYPNRKDWRKPYYKSKRFDGSCRPHGRCPYCKRNREFSNSVKEFDSEEQIKEYEREVC